MLQHVAGIAAKDPSRQQVGGKKITPSIIKCLCIRLTKKKSLVINEFSNSATQVVRERKTVWPELPEQGNYFSKASAK